LPLGKIAYELVKVAKAHSYIETLGHHADSLHNWIKSSYEEDFKGAFQDEVRKAVRLLNVNFAKLAFDTTSEPFWGKTRSLYIFGTHNEKHDGEFHFITVCLITRNKQIPIMALPVHLGSTTAKLIIELMEFCRSLFTKIRLTVFDRGFYNAELIDYLEANHIKYLILVPERGDIFRKYVIDAGTFGKFRHELVYSKAKSNWRPKTMIVICKDISKEFSWIFATNIQLKTRCEYILNYKSRWQIETNYRVEDESRIKSKSVYYLIRYFYFLVSLLLHLLWIVNKNLNYYVPFKRYIDIIEQKLLCDYLEIEQI
jgi:hypothetical protein